MTFREKLVQDHPDWSIRDIEVTIEHSCPADRGYSDLNNFSPNCIYDDGGCGECWNREMPEMYGGFGIPKNIFESPKPTIKDSGDRTEFASGAVRDMHEGKGRCDLLPLDVIGDVYEQFGLLEQHERDLFRSVLRFMESGNVKYLYDALEQFREFDNLHTMFLEVAKHFEEGAKKYGDNNWRKGIPVRCYIDSAVRHYLKYLRGDKDEPHDRAFCWNILCCIWTCKHMPELNDYAKEEDN